MDIASVSAFITKHQEGLALLALAFIVTMRDGLPYPFNKVDLLNWCYAWLHDALKTLANMRSGGNPTAQRPPEAKADGTIPKIVPIPTVPPVEKSQ